MTKEELVKNAAQYFVKQEVNLMLATSDGNFFHSHSKSAALSHINGKDLQMFEITRSDVEGKPAKKEPAKEVVEKTEVKETEVKTEVSESSNKADKPKMKPKKDSDKNK